MAERRNWTRQEVVRALDLYCRTPFGRVHNRNPEIIALATELDRTPSAIALKMTNFAGLDSSLDRAGMSNHSRLDREVWEEFREDTEGFIAEVRRIVPLSAHGALEESPEQFVHRTLAPEGLDRLTLAKARVNQDYFRDMVLASYDGKCAVTGIDIPALLIASHIVPWAKADAKTRTDPRNGLCLNALHDRAFNDGYLMVDEEFRLRLSKPLAQRKIPFFERYADAEIALPQRFRPDASFLRWHQDNVFIR